MMYHGRRRGWRIDGVRGNLQPYPYLGLHLQTPKSRIGIRVRVRGSCNGRCSKIFEYSKALDHLRRVCPRTSQPMVYGTFSGAPAAAKKKILGSRRVDHHQLASSSSSSSSSLDLQLQWIRQTQEGQSNAFRYIVKPGDTLESIAASTHTSLEHLIALNPYLVSKVGTSTSRAGSSASDPEELEPTDVLKKSCSLDKHLRKSRKNNNNNTLVRLYPGSALTIDKPGRVQLPPTPALIDQGWGQMHLVTASDSLASIAAAYNTTPVAIRQANRQTFPSGQRGHLHAGQLLCIRQQNTGPGGQAMPSSSTDEERLFHVIDQSRDSFESIFRQYQLNWTTFMKYNQRLFPTGSALTLVHGMMVTVASSGCTKNQEHTLCGHQDQDQNRIGEIQLTKAIHEVLDSDTPESIAREYHMSLDELRSWNRSIFPKGYRGKLAGGQKLVVKKRS